MRIIREGHLYQLTFLPRFFPVNCYLVEEDDSLTLIDAALPYSAKKILKAAKKINKPITRILLTHAHDDHVGALDKIKQLLPDVPVHISSRDARLMSGDITLDPNEPDTPIRGGVPKNLKTRADILLQNGDQIGSLIAIDAPGHTPGSMAYFDTRSRTLIAGDAFQTRGGMAVTGQLRPLFPFPAMATWNKETALQSAHKLLEYNPSLLAVGHGKMLKQPEKAITHAITKAKLNIEHI
ncbi:glyoxylase-like metal-dependent hydrolase (beta-lactamase superfamily II) [Bacillus aryabhattai]|jgi:glyoxylase-like metal-dependent hydrolase (beta-lactamase superfamily II)|uniref:Glyoxylase-like metal-dependent hydrolase (Beta-lactamase superfamily II) n=1 Tax=Priestia aryabhattai TaxID=412384 RepID=A0A7W3NF88_PRIAR|nr:MBL fold metallo-hydrolase [Priestia aryabhattai]MBA9041781.1 glyoxylase-like metal-dependent hydrolase (beta-lactamase superfamily II) [Priestia aryabhattai]